jgi:predicted RNA-binding Zn-ribbon protein involved in translation (DUF1610 family)
MREYPKYIVPHAHCCGLITAVRRRAVADLLCNECGAILRTLPADTADDVLAQMAATDTVTSHTCPHCGGLNAFPGFSLMFAYVCRHCGQGVAIDEPRA